MIDNIRTLQKDYEEILHATKEEKNNIKKSIPKLERLKIQNEELGVSVEGFTEKIQEATEKLETYNQDIVKYKKVIHRLGVCINILQDEEIEEVASDVMEEEEE